MPNINTIDLYGIFRIASSHGHDLAAGGEPPYLPLSKLVEIIDDTGARSTVLEIAEAVRDRTRDLLIKQGVDPSRNPYSVAPPILQSEFDRLSSVVPTIGADKVQELPEIMAVLKGGIVPDNILAITPAAPAVVAAMPVLPEHLSATVPAAIVPTQAPVDIYAILEHAHDIGMGLKPPGPLSLAEMAAGLPDEARTSVLAIAENVRQRAATVTTLHPSILEADLTELQRIVGQVGAEHIVNTTQLLDISEYHIARPVTQPVAPPIAVEPVSAVTSGSTSSTAPLLPAEPAIAATPTIAAPTTSPGVQQAVAVATEPAVVAAAEKAGWTNTQKGLAFGAGALVLMGATMLLLRHRSHAQAENERRQQGASKNLHL